MRTTKEIIKEINENQLTYDRLIMEIGEGYTRYKLTNNSSLESNINDKVETLQRIELVLKNLEKELKENK